MRSSETTSSSSIPYKSKKAVNSSSKSKSVLQDDKSLCTEIPSSKSALPDDKSLNTKTPEKTVQIPGRTRSRKVALSINDIRRAAESLRGSNRQLPHDRADESKSVSMRIDSLQKEIPSGKAKAVIEQKKIPEKYRILNEFFDSLDCAIRLLMAKGSAPNFSSICPMVESLTDRRFSYGHLAQLKFILPEAIEIKKILVLDKRTSCMKPDLHISFNLSVLDNQIHSEKGSQNMRLRKMFYTQLSEYLSSQPEADEVPKSLLPEPFNRFSQNIPSKASLTSSDKTSIEQLSSNEPLGSSSNVREEVPFVIHVMNGPISIPPMTIVNGPSKEDKSIEASRLPQSLKRYFSQKVITRKAEEVDQVTRPCTENSSNLVEATNKMGFSNLESCSNDIDSNPLKLVTTPARLMVQTPAMAQSHSVEATTKMEFSNLESSSNDIDSTPVKLVSTPARLMVRTPVMAPPKRGCMSPDDDTTCSISKLVRRPPSRSLIFDTPTKKEKIGEEIHVIRTSLDDEFSDVRPQSLPHSIIEKERKAKEELSPEISQAKRRRQTIAGLPKLSNSICFLFHNRTVIMKEELIHKIIAGNLDIIDRRELEEQLTLLQELVPEWISENLTSSGDLIICINKLLSAEMVRARIEEAK